MTRISILTIGIATTLQSAAVAQSDSANREDRSDYYYQSNVEDEVGAYLPVADGKGTGLSSELSLSTLYSTNADQTLGDHISAIYSTPTFSLSYKGRSRTGWKLAWDFVGDGDYFPDHGRDLSETRLSSSLRISRDLDFGQVTAGFRGRATFARLFDEHLYTRVGPFLTFRPRAGRAFNLSLDAEYRFADEANARRFLLRARGRAPLWTLSDTGSMSLLQEFRVSIFRDGNNAGRRDLRSSSTLQFVPNLKLAQQIDVAISATLFHNLSNRSARRFTNFEAGPSVSFAF